MRQKNVSPEKFEKVSVRGFDIKPTIYHLGDMLSAGGDCSLAIIRCTTWGTFKKLLSILTSNHISLTVRGKVFDACVRSALLHGSEMWDPTTPYLQRLRRNDRSIIRWICGVKPHEAIVIDLLCAKLGIQELPTALRSKRLRWYEHVVRSSSCINSVTNMEVPCSKSVRDTKKDMVSEWT